MNNQFFYLILKEICVALFWMAILTTSLAFLFDFYDIHIFPHVNRLINQLRSKLPRKDA